MNHSSAFTAIVAAAAVVAVTPLVKRVAFRLRAVARPKQDRWHTRTVPLLGGVAVVFGVALALLTFGGLDRGVIPVVLVCGGMFAVGLVDDLVRLKPASKLVAQIVVACAFPLFGGASSWQGPSILDGVVAIAWIVAITNSLNLLVNMDGLCAGVAAIASFGCWVALAPTNSAPAAFAAAIVGACAGFLVYNFKPASIFMGDAGSLFLGSALAVLSISPDRRMGAGVVSTLAVPVLLLLIPIFDTAFVTFSRILSTRSASQGGRDHTSHRLVAMGFSERQAVLFLWMLAAAGSGIAVLSRSVDSFGVVLLAPLLLIALTLLGIQLARVSVYDGDDFSRLVGKPYTPLLVDVTYRRRLFEVLLDVVLITCAYAAAYVLRFDRDTPKYYSLIRESLPIVIGCELLAFYVAGLYRGTWRYIGLSDLTTFVKGAVLGVFGSVMALVYLYRFQGYSRAVFVIDLLLLGLLVAGSRLSFRILGDAAGRRRHDGSLTLVYGAGDAGALLVSELRNNASHGLTPIGFVDDDRSKHGKRMLRLPVVGGVDDLPRVIGSEGVEVIVISTLKIPADRIRAIESVCHASGTRILWMRFGLETDSPRVQHGR
jgi:UDP-GlcNAc:undecaprenyl-phosphate GlcNAc-1-phosphate transferase